MPIPNPQSSPRESETVIVVARNLMPGIHRFGKLRKHFWRDSRLTATLQTDSRQATHSYKVVGGHRQHKHVVRTLKARTIAWRMQPPVLAEPKPCSISFRLR
jgi:hypothetical protein